MKRELRKQDSRSRKSRRTASRLTWILLIAVVAGVFYLVSQSAGVAYTDRQLTPVNFSALNPDQKHSALVAANRASCTCGCGMTLAQCVATDSTCPIREDNIKRIQTIVRDAER